MADTFANRNIRGVRADCYSRDVAKLVCLTRVFDRKVCAGKCGTNLLYSGLDQGRSLQYCAVRDWKGFSELSPETMSWRIALKDCGGNLVCYHLPLETCCIDVPLFYVNSLTGEVRDGNAKDSDATASPTWWSIDTAAILASSTAIDRSRSAALPTTTSLTSVEIKSSLSGATASSTPAATSTSIPSDAQRSSGGLYAGTGAGIGIGSAAAVTDIAMLAWLFFRGRKRRRALQAQVAPTYQPRNVWKAGARSHVQYQQAEPRLQELDPERSRQEMG
ncbi:hypothetical protein EJ02DRAFT_510374 [Clathrospora elynae]|uniref:Uncharacterized protein n=1 Tax=Clathrospora elynae TaxID=706981 RepID=A0A6A5SUB2_9PLEO|nr:hypothetical protein EJ02DRAFT_510374 [Clathrospora elynae]